MDVYFQDDRHKELKEEVVYSIKYDKAAWWSSMNMDFIISHRFWFQLSHSQCDFRLAGQLAHTQHSTIHHTTTKKEIMRSVWSDAQEVEKRLVPENRP